MDLLAKEKGTVASFLSARELLSKIKLFYSPIKPPLTLKNTGVALKSQMEGLKESVARIERRVTFCVDGARKNRSG